MREALIAGAAVHNAGHHHAAHDAWERRWLSVKEAAEGSSVAPDDDPAAVRRSVAAADGPTPTGDERLLHGLVQFSAAVHHLGEGNESGATGLADSAGAYLRAVPDGYRGVELGTVRSFLDRLAADPADPRPGDAPDLVVAGRRATLDGLRFPAAAVAAEALADEWGYDPAVVADAVAYAGGVDRTRAEGGGEGGSGDADGDGDSGDADGDNGDADGGDAGGADLAEARAAADRTRFRALVVDFLAAGEDRGLVYDRMRAHVERRRRREDDVAGLFD